ncbi:MAG: hypothetical protein ACI8Z1_004031 [Candidatus Azotimanducaceae bacterium]|jgi:hypothetical protein
MTIKIIVIKEDKPIAQVLMEQDKLSIGRRAECDVPIKDPAVSGTHAEIEFVGNGYILRDLGSTNGVHVKGRRIKERALKDKDLITIGEHQLRVMITDNAPPQKKSGVETPQAEPTRELTEVRKVPVINQTDGYLKFVVGGGPGDVVKLDEAMTSIGVPGIQMAAVSKRPQGHFIIHVDGGKERDKTPVVNGELIGFKSRKLEVGDLIEVAQLQFEYCFD